MSARALRGLYAITPELESTEELVARVHACIAGGAALVQYRAKGTAVERQREQATRLARMCRENGVLFIVNDSIELAGLVGADGVHLGREDADVRAARAALGSRVIGISCYNEIERVRSAAQAGADYVAIGSVFASRTKPGAVNAPLALLGEAKRVGQRPVAAIGGITPANSRDAIAAGADMLAVISAVFDAPDVEAASHAIARFFEEHDGALDVRAQPRAV